MSRYETERQVALQAVVEAAALCRDVQTQMGEGVLEKADRSPVTVADFGSQALVCRRLANAFPGDPIVAEEDAAELRRSTNDALRHQMLAHVRRAVADAASDDVLDWIDRGSHDGSASRFWTLDPIDGTKGFLRREQYAISLALIVDGRIAVGALCCPSYPLQDGRRRGIVCIAEQDEGAWETSLDRDGECASLRVRPAADQRAIRVCESVEAAHSSHGDSARIAQALDIGAPPVRMDSQAKYAAVARGDADAYLRLPKGPDYREKIWDHAGGVIAVTEAGGRVTDIHGRPLDFSVGRSLQKNRGVVVTSGAFHEAFIDAIAALGIGRF